MNFKILIILLLLFLGTNVKCQYLPEDSLRGNVKKIREKVIYLTEVENPQLLYYDDYGHSGFNGPESTINKFRDIWFSSNFCYYINYERHFDNKGKITKDIWYGKKDNFMNSYRMIYDKNNRIVSEIDSTKNSVGNKNYYYERDNITMISENSAYSSFSHTFKHYKNGKIRTLKRFYRDGALHQYRFIYNKNNQLFYRIHIDPNVEEEETEDIYSDKLKEPAPNIYKDIINFYDKKNRLIKHQEYELDEHDKDSKNSVVINQKEYKYIDDHLVREKTVYRTGMESFDQYVYEERGRISKRYCCEEDILKAMIIEEYKYNKNSNEVTGTDYTEEGKKYVVSFKYKYDKNKNWIEIIKNVDGDDLYKWIRDIEYY